MTWDKRGPSHAKNDIMTRIVCPLSFPNVFCKTLKIPLVATRTIHGRILGRPMDTWVTFGDRATVFQQHCQWQQPEWQAARCPGRKITRQQPEAHLFLTNHCKDGIIYQELVYNDSAVGYHGVFAELSNLHHCPHPRSIYAKSILGDTNFHPGLFLAGWYFRITRYQHITSRYYDLIRTYVSAN